MPFPHVTGDYACPCGPQYYVLCPECIDYDEEDGAADPNCWRCAGLGEVEVTAAEAQTAREIDDEYIHVVHRHMPGDPPEGTTMAVNTRDGPRWDDDRLLTDDDPDDDGMADVEC